MTTALRERPAHVGRPATGTWPVAGVRAAGAATVLMAAFWAGCTSPSAHGHGPGPIGGVARVATAASLTDPGSVLTPVDLASHTVQPEVPVGGLPGAASLPAAMAFTRGGAALLVVGEGDDTLREIDPATRLVVRSVTVGLEPDAVAVVPEHAGRTGLALVADLGSNTVTPVNLGTWKAGTPIPVGKEPVAIAVAAGKAFVADFGGNVVTPIDLATLRAGAPITVGPGPEAVAVAGREVLVGNFGDATLTPIEAANLQAGTALALPVDPTGIAVTTSGTTAYISGGADIVPLKVDGLAVGRPVPLPGVAEALALGAGDITAWVALQSGSLVPVTLASRKVGPAIHLGGHPSAVAIA